MKGGKKRNNISGTKTADRNELYKGDRKTGLRSKYFQIKVITFVEWLQYMVYMYTNIRTQENIFKKSCFVLRGELESILVVYFSIFSLQCLLFLTSDDCTELKKRLTKIGLSYYFS